MREVGRRRLRLLVPPYGSRRVALLRFLDVVLRWIDDLERCLPRDPPLLHEAALALFQKLVERGCRAGVEIGLQDVQHFAPPPSFAINDSIRRLELQNLLGRISVPTQANLIQADDLRARSALDQ